MKYYSTESYDIDTHYTRFGKMIAETLEDPTKVAEHPVLSTVPLYSVAEYPLLHEVEGVPIKGYIDSFDPDQKRIIEIKTGIRKDGKAPWDRVKVRKHDQVLLYSLCVRDLLGEVDPVIKLIWLETRWQEVCVTVPFGDKTFQNCGPGLGLTGYYEVFEREIAEWEYDRMRQYIVTTAQAISNDYTSYQQSGVDYRTS
jgi:hypothetical protein